MCGNPVSGQKCPRCAKNSLLNDDVTGERFCGKCGYVIPEKFQEPEQEWGSFTQEHGNKAKVATSPDVHDGVPSTIINPINKDAFGKPLTASMKSTVEILRTLDNKSKIHSSADKNLKQAQIEIEKLKDKLVLSDSVIEKTKSIYKNAVERKLTKGYSIKGMVGACLYASCKNLEIPRTLDEISDIINIKKNDILRCYKLIVREFDLQIPVTDPIKHVSRIASKLGLSEKTKLKAISMLEEAKKAGINVGKEPIGIIAGVLYLAGLSSGVSTEEMPSQKDIAEASGVTEVTIRKRCEELKNLIISKTKDMQNTDTD